MATQEEVQEAPVVPTADKPVPEKTFSRDEIRSAILSAPAEDETFEGFGVKLEIRTPNLEDLMQYRDFKTDDTIMARAIANNCYVLGTNDRVFDEADIPELMKTKFGPDMRRLNKAITKVLGGDDAVTQGVEDNTKSN